MIHNQGGRHEVIIPAPPPPEHDAPNGCVAAGDGPDNMVWPTWREKLTPVAVFKWPAYNGFRIDFRDWYFGPWLRVSIGWWCIQIGAGTYDT